MNKPYIDYYPNRIAKLSDFSKHLKNIEKFNDFCNGKNEYFYKDEANYGYHRNTENFTLDQRLEREYLWSDFGLWITWQKAGKNIFDFSEGLLEMLKETDVSDTDIEQIKLPYPSFYIDISKAKIPFAKDCKSLIEGVYISDEINNEKDEDLTYERVITFDFTGKYIEYFKDINTNLYSHVRGFHSYSLYLDKPDKIFKVGEAIISAKGMFVNTQACDDRDDNAKIDLYKVHSEFIERTIKLVVNCLLYLTLKDKELYESFASDLPIHLKSKLGKANTKKRKEVALSDIKNSGFTKIKYVGASIKPLHKYDLATGQVPPHWRRGHWRNQKYGEQFSLSKLIWIIPTIVNKDIGEPRKGHIYTIESSR